MNERFEQLKRRAVAEADTSHIDFDNMSHSEIQMLGDIAVERKFAELIVRECAYVANAGIDPAESHLIGNDILKHFGVEE